MFEISNKLFVIWTKWSYLEKGFVISKKIIDIDIEIGSLKLKIRCFPKI